MNACFRIKAVLLKAGIIAVATFLFESVSALAYNNEGHLRPRSAVERDGGVLVGEFTSRQASKFFGPNFNIGFDIQNNIWKILSLRMNGQIIAGNDRTLKDLERVFYGQEAIDFIARNEKIIAYKMFRDLFLNEADKAIIKEKDLRCDITVISPLAIPSRIGYEPIKTAGHYHPAPNAEGKPGIDKSFTEVYAVLSGEALYYLQKIDENGNVVDVVQIRAKAGDIVPVPSTYGHITINPSSDKSLVMMNWVSSKFSSSYERILELNGAAYYFIEDAKGGIKAVLNPAYKGVVTKEEFKRKFSDSGEELFDWLAQNSYLEHLSDGRWRFNAVTDELLTALEKKYSAPAKFKEISDYLRVRQSKSVSEVRAGQVDNKLSEAIGLPQGEPVYNIIENNEKVEKLADFLSNPEDPLVPKFDGILGGSALIRSINILDIKMHSWGISSKWNPFMDALKNVKGAKGALVVGADTVFENAGVIAALRQVKQSANSLQIVVWAKNQEHINKLKLMKIDDIVDVYVSDGLNAALATLERRDFANEKIVLINSPKDIERIKQEFKAGGLSEVIKAKPGLKAVNLDTASAENVNITPLAVARAVSSILQDEKEVVSQYQQMNEEYADKKIISAEDLAMLNDLTSEVAKMPLARATEDVAKIQTSYAETWTKI